MDSKSEPINLCASTHSRGLETNSLCKPFGEFFAHVFVWHNLAFLNVSTSLLDGRQETNPLFNFFPSYGVGKPLD
jgi:hypothetical protein